MTTYKRPTTIPLGIYYAWQFLRKNEEYQAAFEAQVKSLPESVRFDAADFRLNCWVDPGTELPANLINIFRPPELRFIYNGKKHMGKPNRLIQRPVEINPALDLVAVIDITAPWSQQVKKIEAEFEKARQTAIERKILPNKLEAKKSLDEQYLQKLLHLLDIYDEVCINLGITKARRKPSGFWYDIVKLSEERAGVPPDCRTPRGNFNNRENTPKKQYVNAANYAQSAYLWMPYHTQ